MLVTGFYCHPNSSHPT